MTTEEAACYVRFSRTTFDQMVNEGRVKFSRPAGPVGTKRFLKVHLDEFMRAAVTTADAVA